MQGFKKLALVAAIAAVPVASFAMQPMNDSQMSGVTGRDGIDISITTNNLTLNQVIYDRDGIGAANAHNLVANMAGAIEMNGVGINTGGSAITLAIDAGQDAGGNAVLNVNVGLPANMTIATGDLYVGTTANAANVNYNDSTGGANSWKNASAWTTAGDTKIMNSSTITLGATSLNIQLGHVAQTMTLGTATVDPMILVSTTITGGIVISNTGLIDATTAAVQGTGSSLNVGHIWMVDGAAAGPGTNLSVGSVGIDVTNQGLAIGIGSIGDATYGVNQYMTRVDLGNGTAIGDVAITGLNLNGTVVTIAGH
jgi:hypothetical protein